MIIGIIKNESVSGGLTRPVKTRYNAISTRMFGSSLLLEFLAYWSLCLIWNNIPPDRAQGLQTDEEDCSQPHQERSVPLNEISIAVEIEALGMTCPNVSHLVNGRSFSDAKISTRNEVVH